MISLAECAPCRAKRLQEESEREFRERYGMIDLNRHPLRMGWRPFLGQVPAPSVLPAAAPEPAVPPRGYLDRAKERLLWFGVGTGVGYPIGILTNIAFKSLRKYRKEAATFAAMTAGIGLLAALLPFEKSEIVDGVSRIAGVFTGSALADLTLPRANTTGAIAKAI